jgi:hypothetical protein
LFSACLPFSAPLAAACLPPYTTRDAGGCDSDAS